MTRLATFFSGRPLPFYKFLNKSNFERKYDTVQSCICKNSTMVGDSVPNEVETPFGSAQPFSNIPGPKGIPYLGSWLDYKLNPEKINRRDIVIKEFQSRYGNIVKETIAGKEIVHIFHPDYIRKVYEEEGKYPTIPPLLDTVKLYRKDKDLAPGLGFSNGEDWYRLRSVVQKIMVRPQKAMDYLPVQNEVSNDFVSKLALIINDQGYVKNFNMWICRWGLESAAKITFDTRLGFMDESGHQAAEKIIHSNSEVFGLSTKLFFSLPFFKYVPTPSIKKIYKCEDFIIEEGKRLLDSSILAFEEMLKSGKMKENHFQFLSYMLNSKTINYGDILAVVNSVFTDTLSTTSQALLFNLYMISINPEAQEKAYEEAERILSDSGDLTVQGFNTSRYIKACIKETFRFLPIGIDIQRLCPSNMVIGGYQVPKDTYLVLEPYVGLNDPVYVNEPDMFMPERWLRDDSNEKIHPYLIIPFSIGTRMCAGRRFAEQELVMMIAKILKKYRLEWHHKDAVHMHYQLLQVPNREVSVKFVPR